MNHIANSTEGVHMMPNFVYSYKELESSAPQRTDGRTVGLKEPKNNYIQRLVFESKSIIYVFSSQIWLSINLLGLSSKTVWLKYWLLKVYSDILQHCLVGRMGCR